MQKSSNPKPNYYCCLFGKDIHTALRVDHSAKHLKQNSSGGRNLFRDNVETILLSYNVLSEHSIIVSPKEPAIATKVFKMPGAQVATTAPHSRIHNDSCSLFDPAKVCDGINDTHHLVPQDAGVVNRDAT